MRRVPPAAVARQSLGLLAGLALALYVGVWATSLRRRVFLPVTARLELALLQRAGLSPDALGLQTLLDASLAAMAATEAPGWAWLWPPGARRLPRPRPPRPLPPQKLSTVRW